MSPDEANKLRNSTSNIIFRNVFIEQLKKLNPLLIDDHQDVNELIKAIENVPANINGNQQAWEYLKGLRTVFVQNEKRSRNVKLIDEITLDNNKYQITDEFTYENGKNKIRADLVFLINGIPILLIETKAPIKQNAMNEALEQINRYHTECPKLMSVLQLYALTNYSQYYYSAT
ncbi:MAG: type I restriction endonuclease subunit R [Bacteroidales bacterium]|nr:type I restriction endonuclease subunit R [Bacteroidales bacterium]